MQGTHVCKAFPQWPPILFRIILCDKLVYLFAALSKSLHSRVQLARPSRQPVRVLAVSAPTVSQCKLAGSVLSIWQKHQQEKATVPCESKVGLALASLSRFSGSPCLIQLTGPT
jgi:hypothetical protein